MVDTALAGEWVLDPARSSVSLRSRSMGGLIRVSGEFRQVTGHGTITDDGQVGGTLTIRTASIDTKNAKRDTHLRSADFFHSDTYPDIVYTVRGIEQAGPGVTVTGLLSIRDQQRPLTFDGTATVGEAEVRLDADVRVNRADFGLTWNWMGMVSMVNDLGIRAVFTRR